MIPLWDIEINRYIETETEIKIPNSTIPLSKCWIETNPNRKEVNKNQFRAFHRRADGEALFLHHKRRCVVVKPFEIAKRYGVGELYIYTVMRHLETTRGVRFTRKGRRYALTSEEVELIEKELQRRGHSPKWG
jgi:hypothetical protein